MSPTLFPLFRYANGEPRTARCPDADGCTSSIPSGYPPVQNGRTNIDKNTLQTFTENGVQRQRIVTETIKSVSKTHYDCQEIEGAEIEDDGGDGTAGSHWEKRVLMTEYMTGLHHTGQTRVLSLFTLALMQDSGWYEVDFRAAGVLKWGQGQGCAFATGLCTDLGSAQGFCSDSNTANLCTFDRTAVGQCNGASTLLDGCAVVLPYRNQVCVDPATTVFGGCGGSPCRGSSYGTSHACFESSLFLANYVLNGPETEGSCYEYRCADGDGDTKILEVKAPDGNFHACEAGKEITASGYNGKITCPTSENICNPGTVAVPPTQSLDPLDPNSPSKSGGENSNPLGDVASVPVSTWVLVGASCAGAVTLYCCCSWLRNYSKRSTRPLAEILKLRSPDPFFTNISRPQDIELNEPPQPELTLAANPNHVVAGTQPGQRPPAAIQVLPPEMRTVPNLGQVSASAVPPEARQNRSPLIPPAEFSTLPAPQRIQQFAVQVPPPAQSGRPEDSVDSDPGLLLTSRSLMEPDAETAVPYSLRGQPLMLAPSGQQRSFDI
eukprot:CAMPEP_0184290964 /NCGR_PEP_ID=MMETSP1049-20130417/3087_1 /TAXON_ID=77928 /ORGANISM="Proteomonas sulcata, Strain CCMP704" /LENGTH=549 /DNA_ID=CAMNT_0026598257 /DNA_START=1 /DNA_END=1650 /DNA_ORIENTATION=-